MSFKYPLANSSWGAEEFDAIQQVISSGQFTMSSKVQLFERNFSTFLGSKHCVMVNSGSSANLLMVAALFYTRNESLKLARGDEVIVPAVSWSTTYYPLHQYGLKIKFVDVDLSTLNYDLQKLASAVTDTTRMIMAVNLLGNPNDFDKIQEIIGDRRIVLLEDNCESLGATYRGKQAGTFGLMGSYSTFYSHHISTMEGGVVSTDDDELHQILLSLRAHGWTRDLPKRNLVCDEKSRDAFNESFRFVLPGYNVRPLEIEAAIGIEQVKRLPHIVSERQNNGEYLQKILGDHPDLVIQEQIGKSSWFGFSLIIRPGSHLTRAVLLARLIALGFECRPIVAGNFAKNEVIKYFDFEIYDNLSNAEYIDANGLFIGNHHYPIKDAIDELKRL